MSILRKSYIQRKIQLIVDYPTKDEIYAVYKKLRKWRYICFRAANMISTHHFVQDRLREFFYLDDKTIARLRNITYDENGILTTSKLNTTYQVLSKNFKGEVPMAIISCLNASVTKFYINEGKEVENGERTLRNYKRTIPMPFTPQYITHVQLSEDKVFYRFVLFGIKFKTFFGSDHCGTKQLWERSLKKEVKLCTCKLIIDERTRKIFLHACFEIEQAAPTLNHTAVAQAVLTIETPLSVRINNHQYDIGNKDEFLFRRMAIQAAMNRIQRSMKFDRPQHGVKRKLRKLETFYHSEKNYIRTKLHFYSRQVINLCLKYGIGTLILVNADEANSALGDSPFLLRNWSVNGLLSLLRSKAAVHGINVILE